ncbi:hypothetical protein WR25_04774 [Diploscapter pachys]|uniref:Saposin B-type domain-containing protein n=1 Tax=Diploscapter pachys TaxID=2018661 RepID=A0A2A2L453_9BILA|nr:hypothetical protein WR25_04774 [Diploscapter pachys]
MKYLLLLCTVVVAVYCVVMPVQRNALDCEMCELLVKSVDGTADRDTKEIEKKFDAECKALFHSIPFGTTECKHYINSKLDPIIKELDSGTAPEDVCKKLGECP